MNEEILRLLHRDVLMGPTLHRRRRSSRTRLLIKAFNTRVEAYICLVIYRNNLDFGICVACGCGCGDERCTKLPVLM